MEEQTQQKEGKKTVYTILSEIENQLILLRRVAYDHCEDSDIKMSTKEELLGIHNTLGDIGMKVVMLMEDNQLDTIKAPATLQAW